MTISTIRRRHRCGKNFQLGEQKLDDFSVGVAKIGEKQSKPSNSKYNFNYAICICLKKVYAAYNGLFAPEAGEFSTIFVSKVTF